MPTESARRSRPIDTGVSAAIPAERRESRLGRVPLLAFSAGAGLLVCSVANALSRATLDPPMLLYWTGILIVALPIFWRLTSREASDGERLALVCMLGLALYGVKIARDVPLFTFSDELIHAFNAEQIVAHHDLFRDNSILEVTPYYPGLEGAASALMSLTGLSSFVSGIVVVGAARLSLVAALFLLFRRLSGSGRTAGIAVAIYAGNFNFLFWGAQFSYASLSLPLLAVILMALAEREAAPREALRAWAVPIVLATAAVVVTHHLTSYAVVAVLVALAVIDRVTRGTWRPPNPWPFAVLAAGLALAWLVFVASSTVGYLSPVISDAVEATIDTAFGEAPPRALFQGGEEDTATATTPTLARGVAFLAVVILAALLPFGLRQVWRRYRREAFALLFAAAAIAFFGTLALRLAPAAWETGNRASEFLFIGLAFVVACAGLERWPPLTGKRLGRLAPTACLGVILVGGAIAGWPWDSHLASPVKVIAEGRTIVSQPLGVAEWAGRHLPGGRFAATTADSRFLLVPGDKTVIAGRSPDVEDILLDPTLVSWQLPLLRDNDLRYVVTDRRPASGDAVRGYFFERGSAADRELLPEGVASKFESVPGAARIFASGAIVVYDLEGRR